MTRRGFLAGLAALVAGRFLPSPRVAEPTVSLSEFTAQAKAEAWDYDRLGPPGPGDRSVIFGNVMYGVRPGDTIWLRPGTYGA